ncbi:MAG: asparaginase [Pseudomonadota bacterium]
MADVKLVEVTRGGVVESEHFGVAAVVDHTGRIRRAWGDPERRIFPRSAMKPIQSLVLAEAGLNLSPEQWALSGASHDGEPMHTERVLSWLKELGHAPSDLACGPAWPSHSPTRKALIADGAEKARIYHNCSGKHAGQLALCAHCGWDPVGYQDADHPAQTKMLARLAELADMTPFALGIDGCSLPAPQLTLQGFGRALAQISKMAATSGSAAETVIANAISHVELTGGSTQWNGRLTKATGGRAYVKSGAEGVFGVIMPRLGLALVVKATDGASRASECAVAGLIREVSDTLDLDGSTMTPFATIRHYNAAGLVAGDIRFVGGAGHA